MSLTDLMSGAGLSGYAEVGLIAFMIAFGLILWRIFSPRNRATYEHLRTLPIDEDEPRSSTRGSAESGTPPV